MQNKNNNKKLNIQGGIIFALIITAIIALILWYIFLPAFNIKSPGLWVYVLFINLFFTLILASGEIIKYKFKSNTVKINNFLKISAIIFFILLAVFIILLFTSSKMLKSKEYAVMISNNIREDSIENYNATLDNVPLIDKDSAVQISNRIFGSLVDVSDEE